MDTSLPLNKTLIQILRTCIFSLKSVLMEPTSLVVVVSNVRECVPTTHLVTSQPGRVIMGAAIIGLENFVKVLRLLKNAA